MTVKIVFDNTSLRILAVVGGTNLDSLTPVYDPSVATCVQVDAPEDIFTNRESYFYRDGQVVRNAFGSMLMTADVSEIPADGTSFATFTLSKVSSSGISMTSLDDNDIIDLSCTRGKLSTMSV